MTLWSHYIDNLFFFGFLLQHMSEWKCFLALNLKQRIQTQQDSVCGVERGSVGGEGDGGERKWMVSDAESSEKPSANSPFEFLSLSFCLAFSPKSSHGHSPCWFLSETSLFSGMRRGIMARDDKWMEVGGKAGIMWLSVVCIWGRKLLL